jgi:hypothetical protein
VKVVENPRANDKDVAYQTVLSWPVVAGVSRRTCVSPTLTTAALPLIRNPAVELKLGNEIVCWACSDWLPMQTKQQKTTTGTIGRNFNPKTFIRPS